MKLIDSYGREASYLRLSITDRCNFNCIYCRDGANQNLIPPEDLLGYEEMERLVGITTGLGIGKVRITGGEPFLRNGMIEFLARLRQRYPEIALSITTNGSLMEPFIQDLKKIGLSSINLSLDSFNPNTFEKLTNNNSLPKILANLEKAIKNGLKIKINAVALRGITDQEIDSYLYAVKSLPLDLRFIEFMPLGVKTKWNNSLFLSATEILKEFKSRTEVIPIENDEVISHDKYSGPAKLFVIPKAKGRIGFISAMSSHFCINCNRLRVTARGGVRTCLFAAKEYNLRNILRKKEIRDNKIAQILQIICKSKPIGSEIMQKRKTLSIIDSPLVSIGG